MSKTYRTDKERQIAERRMPRDREGNLVLPRIVRRKPRPGDIHPILKRQLNAIFGRLPLEYLYNLSSVEMLPRKDGVGGPFGLYMHDENRIILYSLPLDWELDYKDAIEAERVADSLYLETYGARVEIVENTAKVTWSDPRRMGLWLCCIVLVHEFGHHFRSTYRAKRKPGWAIRRNDEEFFADSKSYDALRHIFFPERTGTPQKN